MIVCCESFDCELGGRQFPVPEEFLTEQVYCGGCGARLEQMVDET